MRVTKIEQAGNENVYNMEVENHHNFAVNGGFIVHNCDALRYFCVNFTDKTKKEIPPKHFNFEFEKPKPSPLGRGDKIHVI